MTGLSWQRCVVSLLLQLMSLIVKAWWIQDVRRWLVPLTGAQIASFSQWQIPYGLLDHSQSRVVESVVFYRQSLTSNAAEGQVWLCTLQRGRGQNDGKRRWNTKQVPRRTSNSKRSEREREREMQIALKNHFVYQWFSQRADDTKRVRLSGASATTELVKAAW